ncbi:MFS transporter [Achromobacter seleniivolatilans]|uniref:MFS transporter n=1 Tax=Achromobacter seleniivolatilans TaxID=3047478 RepID=A0ABY9M3U5_9BURK|nr:MFS transporter [Achromobacter sp. R39]WMD20848.1 MFS transporter [Achromobacter sp. R39]
MISISSQTSPRSRAFFWFSRLFAGASAPRPLLAVIGIFIGAFMTSLHTRMISVGQRDLGGVFGLSIDEMAWLITVLNASQLLIAPAVPWFATVFGMVRVVGIAGVLLLLACIATPYATSIEVIFALHIAQGILLGIFLSVTLLIVFKSLRPALWIAVMAFYGLRIVVGVNVGVPMAGVFADGLGWQWIYWTTGLLSMCMVWMIWKALPGQITDKAMLKRTDWPGIIMFCGGLTLLYAGIDQGERLDWLGSGVVVSCLVGGAALALIALVRAEFTPAAFPSRAGISNRNILLGFVLAGLYGMLISANAALVSTFLSVMGGLKAIQMGWVLLFAVAGNIAAIPIVIWLGRRVDARVNLALGLTLFAIAAVMGTTLTNEWRAHEFTLLLVVMGVAHSFVFVGLMAVIVSNVVPQNILSMLSFIPVIRIILPTISAAALSAWLRNQGAHYRAVLGESLPAGDTRVAGQITALQERYAGMGAGDPVFQAKAGVGKLIAREANVLAFMDGFHLVLAVCLVALFVSLLVRAAPWNPVSPPLKK